MTDLSAARRLVKSPPELWAEISDPEALAKHLGEFGEIRITKVVPEHTVVWEGDLASGVARIESSGWGTKVVLSAEIPEPAPEIPDPEPQPEPAPQPPPEPVAPPEPESPPDVAAEFEAEPEPIPCPPHVPDEDRISLLARLFGVRWTKRPELQHLVPEAEQAEPEPPATPEPAPEPDTVAFEPVFETPDPDPVEMEPPEPEAPAIDPDRALAVLDGTLDALGSAHHRPFSRA